MFHQRRSAGSLAKTAALFFFVGLVIADGVVAFFLLRHQMETYFASPSRVYLPVIQKEIPGGDPSSKPSTSSPAATATLIAAATQTPLPAGKTYIVQSGDTLFQIAKDHGVTVDELVSANHIADRNVIHVGQELVIPSSLTATPTPRSTPGASLTPYP